MNTMFLQLKLKFQALFAREDGQDLVEYALLVSLIALAAVAGVSGLAKEITAVFTAITNSITPAS